MKRIIKTMAVLCMLTTSLLASAQQAVNQQIPPWMMNEINKGNSDPNTQSQNAAAQAAAQRMAQEQWQAREDAIQAKIAKWRATPYYGSLITQGDTNTLYWGGGVI